MVLNKPIRKNLVALRQPKKLKPKIIERLYTMSELMRLAGISRKQASYWATIKLVNPSLRNTKARAGTPTLFYSAQEVIKAMILADLKRAGFSLQQTQQVLRNLEENGIKLDKSENYLITDGYSIYYANTNNEVIDILKHNRQMLLLIPVHEQVQKLQRIA